jgi:glycosyltransferase involved in cell wall biosynthesis
MALRKKRMAPKLAILLYAVFGGGAEQTMLKLAGGIAARGYDVDLVLAQVEGELLNKIPESVRVVNLNSKRVLTSLTALVRYLRRERPAALLSVLHYNIVALWARALARVPTRVVVSERNMLSWEVRNFSSDLRWRLMPLLTRIFYPWADEIVAVSKGVADDLSLTSHLSPSRIRVIYNPVVTPDFRRLCREPLEHPWFVTGAPHVVLAVGRLIAQKDFPSLIRAFAQVRDARLMILGEGDERPELEGLVKRLGLQDVVSLPGFIENPYPYMARASVFVLSSRWEGLPGVLVEAMACGTPLVAADCPSGPREILADGKYGRLVPVHDVNALAEAINSALQGKVPPPPPESGKPFEIDVVVEQYLDALLG